MWGGINSKMWVCAKSKRLFLQKSTVKMKLILTFGNSQRSLEFLRLRFLEVWSGDPKNTKSVQNLTLSAKQWRNEPLTWQSNAAWRERKCLRKRQEPPRPRQPSRISATSPSSEASWILRRGHTFLISPQGGKFRSWNGRKFSPRQSL